MGSGGLSPTFLQALDIVFESEGGYSNRPVSADPGGETMYGISRRSHPDAWAHGAPSKEVAALIMRAEYWDRVRGNDLPWPLALMVFDTAVLSGPYRAILDLQLACRVTADGKIGPVTLAAAEKLNKDPERLGRMMARRVKWLSSLTNWHVNDEGWLKRMFKNAFHVGRLMPMAAVLFVLAGCASDVGPREQFSRYCASTGEAQLVAFDAYKAGVVPDATYRQLYSGYLSAVATCRTLPESDEAARVASSKVLEFLTRVSNTQGVGYDVPQY